MILRLWRVRLLGVACIGASWGCSLWLRVLMARDSGQTTPGEIGLLIASFGLTFAGLALLTKRRETGSDTDRTALGHPLDRR